MPAALRDSKGRILPGSPAMHPAGRPSGSPVTAAGLARYIASQTENGYELVDRLLVLMRNGGSPKEQRLAAESLLDRLIGKPLVTIDAVVAPTPVYSEALRQMSDEDFALVRGAIERSLSPAAIDVTYETKETSQSNPGHPEAETKALGAPPGSAGKVGY